MPIPAVFASLGKFALDTVSRCAPPIVSRLVDKFFPKEKPSSQIVKSSAKPPANVKKASANSRLVQAQTDHQKQLAPLKSDELKLLQEPNNIEKDRIELAKAIAIEKDKDSKKWLALQERLVKVKEEEVKLEKHWQQKQEELAKLELEFRAAESALYRNLLREFKEQDIKLQLEKIQTDWDAIEKNWPSRLSRQDTEELLLKGREQHQLLILVAPPNINPKCPDSLQHDLPIEIRNEIEYFLGTHYPEDSLFAVEFYGGYFNRGIFDVDVKQLKRIREPIPTVVLYSDITQRKVYFHIGAWGWQENRFSKIVSQPWNWEDEKKKLESEVEEEDKILYAIQQRIVTVYKLFAAFFADWYYINLDRNYEPQLFNLESEFPEEWVKPYVEILQEVYRLNQSGVYYDQGLMLVEFGCYEQAVASFDKALEFVPDHQEAWVKRIEALHKLSRYEEALAICDKAIEIKPDWEKAWDGRSWTLYRLGRYEEALTSAVISLDKALDLKPDDYDGWFLRGNALGKLGRNEEAIASYDKAIELKPDEPNYWNNRGNALDALGRSEEAIANYNRALEIKPDYYLTWANRGEALKKLGRYEEVIASCDEALKVKSDYARAWYNKACYCALQGNVEQALESLQQSINLNPDRYREMAKTDSDFDKIREDERFQVLFQLAL